MATIIDWSNHTSDGVVNKYSGPPSTRLSEYIPELVKCVNEDQAIIDTFGTFSTIDLGLSH